MRWLSRSHVRVKAEVPSRGWLVLAMLGAMVLMAGYALYDAWYRPHWPGEPADAAEWDVIVAGQITHHDPELSCLPDTICGWGRYGSSCCFYPSQCCGECYGWHHRLCKNPAFPGWICVQIYYEDQCCFPSGICVYDPSGSRLVCSEDYICTERRGDWLDCYMRLP